MSHPCAEINERLSFSPDKEMGHTETKIKVLQAEHTRCVKGLSPSAVLSVPEHRKYEVAEKRRVETGQAAGHLSTSHYVGSHCVMRWD